MTNVWALNKDESLKLLLLLLQDQVPPESWVLDEASARDSKSVWVHAAADPALRAYIATHGEAQGRYSVHLEYPSTDGPRFPGNIYIKGDIDVDQAIRLLREHLG
jgi:hypothetical protein